MGTPDEHIKKYKKNRKLVDEGILEKKYKEWDITVIFYCAVHLIEHNIYINKNMGQRHCKVHKKRNNIIETCDEFKEIRQEYLALYYLSMDARYESENLGAEDLKDAMGLLEKIEHVYNVG